MALDTFGLEELTNELTEDEGRRNYPYQDTKGLTTIGIGRNLTGRGISDNEVAYLFSNDVKLCCAVMDSDIPWWRTLPPVAQRVMINLCFMGWASFSQFHTFFRAMEAHDWSVAAADLATTLWYKEVADRGPRVCKRLLTLVPDTTHATS